MEDVFDLTGRPPRGWMHAIFGGGPYDDDVGRCVPGPPAPETITVPLPEGGEFVYRLATVGSWSDPEDPIGLYNDVGPTPQPPLTDQERSWFRDMPDDVLLDKLRFYREAQARDAADAERRGWTVFRQAVEEELQHRGRLDGRP